MRIIKWIQAPEWREVPDENHTFFWGLGDNGTLYCQWGGKEPFDDEWKLQENSEYAMWLTDIFAISNAFQPLMVFL